MKTEARYEMTPANLDEAIAMARASTPACRYGQAEINDEEWRAILSRGEEVPVWCTWIPDGDTSLFAAVTGNGPTSRANAFFFAHARDIVIALGEEVTALRDQLASVRADEREACAKECDRIAEDCRISGERYIASECAGAVRDRTLDEQAAVPQ